MKKIGEREFKYQSVMKELVKRYIMKKQQRDQNAGVTEDDLNEIKQDISGFRFELLEILKNNDYKVDMFKQNPGKRKRGKLNLEKAISKNIFDPANKRGGIFEQSPFGTGARATKGSKKSNESKDLNQTKSSDTTIVKDVQETPTTSTKQRDKSNPPPSTLALGHQDSTSSSNTGVPSGSGNGGGGQQSVYKIAMKLKRLTESKIIRKTYSEGTNLKSTPSESERKTPVQSKLVSYETDLISLATATQNLGGLDSRRDESVEFDLVVEKDLIESGKRSTISHTFL